MRCECQMRGRSGADRWGLRPLCARRQFLSIKGVFVMIPALSHEVRQRDAALCSFVNDSSAGPARPPGSVYPSVAKPSPPALLVLADPRTCLQHVEEVWWARPGEDVSCPTKTKILRRPPRTLRRARADRWNLGGFIGLRCVPVRRGRQ